MSTDPIAPGDDRHEPDDVVGHVVNGRTLPTAPVEEDDVEGHVRARTAPEDRVFDHPRR